MIRVSDGILGGADQLELGDDVLHGFFVEQELLFDSDDELGIGSFHMQVVLVNGSNAQGLNAWVLVHGLDTVLHNCSLGGNVVSNRGGHFILKLL